jgi:preprotein translocase subunit Sec61beta
MVEKSLRNVTVMLELIINQLEDFFYYTMPIFYIVGMVFCFVGIPIIIYVYKRKIPKAARTLIWSSFRREPPLLLCHDSGRGELTTIRERKGEGIVVTAQNKYKILPRWMPKIPLSALLGGTPAPPSIESPSENSAQEGQNSETSEQDTEAPQPPQAPQVSGFEIDLHRVFNIKVLKDNFILDYSDWIMKRTFLVGLDLPFFVGYTGKLCLLNPEALALYEAGEMLIRTEDTELFNPKNIAGKSKENALQPLLLLDPRKIQQIIYEGFDQSQIAGIVQDSEEMARIGQGISPKMKLILGIIVIAVLAGAALFILPQIISGFQGSPQGTAQATSFLGIIKHLFRL